MISRLIPFMFLLSLELFCIQVKRWGLNFSLLKKSESLCFLQAPVFVTL